MRLGHRHVAEPLPRELEEGWVFYTCVKCGKVGAAPAERVGDNGWRHGLPRGWRLTSRR